MKNALFKVAPDVLEVCKQDSTNGTCIADMQQHCKQNS